MPLKVFTFDNCIFIRLIKNNADYNLQIQTKEFFIFTIILVKINFTSLQIKKYTDNLLAI